MKKKYTDLNVDIFRFDTKDVITTFGNTSTPDKDFNGDDDPDFFEGGD